MRLLRANVIRARVDGNPTKEDVVRTIIEKRVSFDPYFERGLERAKADGIDLDIF